jgi:hypothetical protein
MASFNGWSSLSGRWEKLTSLKLFDIILLTKEIPLELNMRHVCCQPLFRGGTVRPGPQFALA